MSRYMLMGAMALMVLLAAGALFVAFTSSAPVQEIPASASAPQPRIVIGAETMADVLAALDLKPVEIVHD